MEQFPGKNREEMPLSNYASQEVYLFASFATIYVYTTFFLSFIVLTSGWLINEKHCSVVPPQPTLITVISIQTP